MVAHLEAFGTTLQDLALALSPRGIDWAITGAVAANRYRDIADIESILATKPDLDRDYLSQWFETFDLSDRFRSIESTASREP